MKQSQTKNQWEMLDTDSDNSSDKKTEKIHKTSLKSTNSSLEYLSNLLTEYFLPKIQYYQTTEFTERLYTGINYEEMGNPSLAAFLMEWCGAETEEDCKWIIQNKLPENTSVGDFTKVVLKIIASSKQLMTTMENKPEWLEIYSALSKVEFQIAKYVVSCQSLYV